MIRIICDFENTENIEADCTIHSPSDYIAARQAIHRHLNQQVDSKFTVLVRSPIVARWLDDLRDYGPHLVDFQITSVRQRFQERFGIPMPSTVTITVVTEFKILDWIPSWINSDDIEGSILQKLLSDVWLPNALPSTHWSEFVQWALHAEQPAPSLVPLMQLKLSVWQRTNPKYRIFDSISTLRDKAIEVAARWYLRSYPERFLREVGLHTTLEIPIEIDTLVELIGHYRRGIVTYWSHRFSEFDNPSDALLEALETMSGLSEAELTELVDHVERNPQLVTPQLVRSIQGKFAKLGNLESTSNRLKAITPPTVPPMAPIEAGVVEMLDWVQDKYIPYFTWVLRYGKSRTAQIQLADHFADWLYIHYRDFIFNSMSPLVAHQLHQFRELVSFNRLVLWVIVDGMTWWEGIHLSKISSDFQLNVTQIYPQVAALPSITSVSKRAMVRGYLDNQETGISNVEAAIEEIRKRYGKASLASTDIKTIQTAIQKTDDGVFLWFYNELDIHHHQSNDFSDEVVEGHLKHVLQSINNIAQRCKKRGVQLSVFVSSDHGCTRLPDNARHLKLPKFANEWDIDEPELNVSATRACSVKEIITSSAVAGLADEWYVLQKDHFNLPFDFIVPKSYNYVGRRPKGWTHGGLSPEEVIVPLIQLQAESPSYQPCRVEFVGNIRTNFVSNVKITITNPNDFELRNADLSFQWIEPRLIDFGIIPPRKKLEQEIELAARTIEGSNLTLEYFLSYYIHGQELLQNGQATLPVRRLMTTNSSIDDMFNG